MIEVSSKHTRTEHALLDIGEGIGALVIYTRAEVNNQQIEVSPKGEPWRRIHTEIHERRTQGISLYAALFQELPEGDYDIWGSEPEPIGDVTITSGSVSEIDWRRLYLKAQTPGSLELLPPRYRDTSYICAAPMAAAPMRYTPDGKVAWDEMWTDFCDLALAGGPPHRGTLLEPVMPEEIRADPDGYERVIAEIERGLRLVTGLSTVRTSSGWIGLQCSNEEMAVWLLRAIVVENVCVRREGRVLYLPAGPAFQLEKEIKNVITVVAKTNHYWIEHVR